MLVYIVYSLTDSSDVVPDAMGHGTVDICIFGALAVVRGSKGSGAGLESVCCLE
jgi:hypothetical protein